MNSLKFCLVDSFTKTSFGLYLDYGTLEVIIWKLCCVEWRESTALEVILWNGIGLLFQLPLEALEALEWDLLIKETHPCLWNDWTSWVALWRSWILLSLVRSKAYFGWSLDNSGRYTAKSAFLNLSNRPREACIPLIRLVGNSKLPRWYRLFFALWLIEALITDD